MLASIFGILKNPVFIPLAILIFPLSFNRDPYYRSTRRICLLGTPKLFGERCSPGFPLGEAGMSEESGREKGKGREGVWERDFF